MRGEYMIGDKVYAKTEFCRVALLGEIEVLDGAHAVIRMCGYHHSNRIPQKVTTRLDLLDPHQDVIQRWQDRADQAVNTRLQIEIEKLSSNLKEAMSNDKKIIWKP